jgi:hypothetical protein
VPPCTRRSPAKTNLIKIISAQKRPHRVGQKINRISSELQAFKIVFEHASESRKDKSHQNYLRSKGRKYLSPAKAVRYSGGETVFKSRRHNCRLAFQAQPPQGNRDGMQGRLE